MGCACKEKYNKVAKYSDDKDPFRKFNFLEKILAFFGRLAMAILIAALIIIILPLFIVFLLINFILGKEVIIKPNKIIDFFRRNKDKNNKK